MFEVFFETLAILVAADVAGLGHEVAPLLVCV